MPNESHNPTPDEPKEIQSSQDGSESGLNGHGNNSSSPTRYPFFSHAIQAERKIYLKGLGGVMFITILAMWAFPPIYWASLAYPASHVHNLKVWVVDRDGSAIGQGVTAAVHQIISAGSPSSLGWEIVDPSDPNVSDNTQVQNSVVEEKVWAALVVNANATANLQNALHSSSPVPYNSTSAITFYFNQARNELAAGNFIIPQATAFLVETTARLSINSTAQFVQSASDIASVKSAASNAPQALSDGIAFIMYNLRPFNAPVATALILVGQIYTIIFTFIITMANSGLRELIAPVLTLRSYIVMRIVVPTVLYFPLSLSYATISLPFKPPFDAKFTYAGGFFMYWIFVLLMMLAMGLATEAMITVLGQRFIAFFLLGLIISNVSVASLPTDLQKGFFKYGKGFPVYNASQAIRTILFNTKSHLGTNAGVLIAWIALSVFTTALFTFIFERKSRRKVTRNGAI